MKLSRRHLLAACSALPVLTVMRGIPALAAARIPPAAVGETWGLRYWSAGAVPAIAAQRVAPKAPPAWHPEFV